MVTDKVKMDIIMNLAKSLTKENREIIAQELIGNAVIIPEGDLVHRQTDFGEYMESPLSECGVRVGHPSLTTSDNKVTCPRCVEKMMNKLKDAK